MFRDLSASEQKETLIRFIREYDSELCLALRDKLEILYPQYLELIDKLLLLK